MATFPGAPAESESSQQEDLSIVQVVSIIEFSIRDQGDVPETLKDAIQALQEAPDSSEKRDLVEKAAQEWLKHQRERMWEITRVIFSSLEKLSSEQRTDKLYMVGAFAFPGAYWIPIAIYDAMVTEQWLPVISLFLLGASQQTVVDFTEAVKEGNWDKAVHILAARQQKAQLELERVLKKKAWHLVHHLFQNPLVSLDSFIQANQDPCEVEQGTYAAVWCNIAAMGSWEAQQLLGDMISATAQFNWVPSSTEIFFANMGEDSSTYDPNLRQKLLHASPAEYLKLIKQGCCSRSEILQRMFNETVAKGADINSQQLWDAADQTAEEPWTEQCNAKIQNHLPPIGQKAKALTYHTMRLYVQRYRANPLDAARATFHCDEYNLPISENARAFMLVLDFMLAYCKAVDLQRLQCAAVLSLSCGGNYSLPRLLENCELWSFYAFQHVPEHALFKEFFDLPSLAYLNTIEGRLAMGSMMVGEFNAKGFPPDSEFRAVVQQWLRQVIPQHQFPHDTLKSCFHPHTEAMYTNMKIFLKHQ